MAWSYFTSYLTPSDGVISKQAWEELWTAVYERSAAVRTSPEISATPKTLPHNNNYSQVGDLYKVLRRSTGGFYNPDASSMDWSPTAFDAAVANILGKPYVSDPDFAQMHTVDYYNYVRAGVTLLNKIARVATSRTYLERYGLAGGISSVYSGEPDVGQNSWGASSSVAQSRFAADATSPEDNEDSFSGPSHLWGFSGEMVAAWYALDLRRNDGTSNFLNYSGKVRRRLQLRYTFTPWLAGKSAAGTAKMRIVEEEDGSNTSGSLNEASTRNEYPETDYSTSWLSGVVKEQNTSCTYSLWANGASVATSGIPRVAFTDLTWGEVNLGTVDFSSDLVLDFEISGDQAAPPTSGSWQDRWHKSENLWYMDGGRTIVFDISSYFSV